MLHLFLLQCTGYSLKRKYWLQGKAGLLGHFLGMGKISGVLTKIGTFDIIFMYDVSIARLIPIIKLTLVTLGKGRERSKCDCILLFCEIGNM